MVNSSVGVWSILVMSVKGCGCFMGGVNRFVFLRIFQMKSMKIQLETKPSGTEGCSVVPLRRCVCVCVHVCVLARILYPVAMLLLGVLPW